MTNIYFFKQKPLNRLSMQHTVCNKPYNSELPTVVQYAIDVVYLVVILIQQFGKFHMDRQIKCMPFYTASMGLSVHFQLNYTQ